MWATFAPMHEWRIGGSGVGGGAVICYVAATTNLELLAFIESTPKWADNGKASNLDFGAILSITKTYKTTTH